VYFGVSKPPSFTFFFIGSYSTLETRPTVSLPVGLRSVVFFFLGNLFLFFFRRFRLFPRVGHTHFLHGEIRYVSFLGPLLIWMTPSSASHNGSLIFFCIDHPFCVNFVRQFRERDYVPLLRGPFSRPFLVFSFLFFGSSCFSDERPHREPVFRRSPFHWFPFFLTDHDTPQTLTPFFLQTPQKCRCRAVLFWGFFEGPACVRTALPRYGGCSFTAEGPFPFFFFSFLFFLPFSFHLPGVFRRRADFGTVDLPVFSLFVVLLLTSVASSLAVVVGMTIPNDRVYQTPMTFFVAVIGRPLQASPLLFPPLELRLKVIPVSYPFHALVQSLPNFFFFFSPIGPFLPGSSPLPP